MGLMSPFLGIVIENQTKFDLEYVTHNYQSGWPQEDVKKSFVLQGTDQVVGTQSRCHPIPCLSHMYKFSR